MLKKTLLLVAAVLIYANTAFADIEYHRMNGFWVLEKTDVYGVEPDHPELAGFYERFEGMAFEVIGETVLFNNGCGYYQEKQILPLSEVFAKPLLSENEDEASFKIRFKETFDVELNDTITIWNLTDCDDLGAVVLVSPEKLFLIDDGLFYGAFKKVGAKEYLAASGLDSLESFTYHIVMGMVEQYWHENKTLAEAYAWLLEKYPTETIPLKRTLPAANISYEYSEGENTGTAHISYEYKNANRLGVGLSFGISSVYLEFAILEENCTLVRINYYAD